jgi:hypothetical protein
MNRPDDNFHPVDWDELERLVMESNDAMNPANHDVDDPEGPKELVRSLLFSILKARRLDRSVIHPDLLAELDSGSMPEVFEQLVELTRSTDIWDFDFRPDSQAPDQVLVTVINPRDGQATELDFALVRDREVTDGNPWRVKSIGKPSQ